MGRHQADAARESPAKKAVGRGAEAAEMAEDDESSRPREAKSSAIGDGQTKAQRGVSCFGLDPHMASALLLVSLENHKTGVPSNKNNHSCLFQ